VPGTDSNACRLNERDRVVGDQYGIGAAFQCDPRTGRTTRLPGLGECYADASAVNDRGVTVGSSPVLGTDHATVFGRP
jgi:hypothetical protein